MAGIPRGDDIAVAIDIQQCKYRRSDDIDALGLVSSELRGVGQLSNDIRVIKVNRLFAELRFLGDPVAYVANIEGLGINISGLDVSPPCIRRSFAAHSFACV